MGARYANPPLIEALCEFRAGTDTEWDLTIPGLMYERLKQRYPKRQTRLMPETMIKTGRDGAQQETRISPRVFLLTEDRKSLVQVGERLLAVNRLEPYTSWPEFKPEIELAFRALLEVVPELKVLQRVGLRYINRIEIPSERVEFEEYFEFRPFLGEKLPQDLANLVLAAQFAFEDGRDGCRLQLSSAVPDTAGNTSFLLDLDYYVANAGAVIPEEALDWVEQAHAQVEELFEGCIRDPLRQLFGLEG